MKLAIMQPYFLPYIGYFQLMNAVDCFVIYDNIQFTKKGWIHRNRLLQNGKDKMFTLPLKKDSDYLDICNRKLASSVSTDRDKLLAQINGAYKKAPMFNEVMPVVENCLLQNTNNLFDFILHSLHCICDYLDIASSLIVSSNIDIDHQLKGQDKVIAICQRLGASQYINPHGGTGLYEKTVFREHHIDLSFLTPQAITYPQMEHEHVPWLSIIDVMMFNNMDTIHKYLDQYKLS